MSSDLGHEKVVSKVDQLNHLDNFDTWFDEYWKDVVMGEYQKLDEMSDDFDDVSSDKVCVKEETENSKMPLRSYLPSLLDLAENKYREDEYGSGKHYEFSFKNTNFVNLNEPLKDEICTNVLYLHVYDHGVYNLEQMRAATYEV